jgi:hypothetical protein
VKNLSHSASLQAGENNAPSNAETKHLDRVIGISPAPLLSGEAQADYDSVATRVVAVARPRDAIEEFFTRDVIDLTWDILRLRRAKAGLWRAAASKGVDAIHSRIDASLLLSRGPGFAKQWASGNVQKRQEFTEMLKKAELTMNDVMAEALAEVIDSFERFDRMLASAEARRNDALSQIDQHREALGAAIRRAVDKSRTRSFQSSKPAKWAEGRHPDHPEPTPRQSFQREIEHWAEDVGRQGARGK